MAKTVSMTTADKNEIQPSLEVIDTKISVAKLVATDRLSFDHVARWCLPRSPAVV